MNNYSGIKNKTELSSIMVGMLCATVFFASAANASSPQAKGWIITQFHEINGKEITYIAKNFVRLDRVSNNYSVIIDETKGMVFFFSDKQKLLYKTPIKGFNYQSVNLLRMFTGDTRGGDTWKRTGTTKIGNSDSICFESADFSNVFSGAAGGGYLAGEKTKVETVTSLYVSKEIAISKDMSKVLSQLQGTKDLGRVPLQEVTTWKVKNKTKTNLALHEVKRAVIEASKGVVPAGYRETSTLSDITNLDKSSAEELLCK